MSKKFLLITSLILLVLPLGTNAFEETSIGNNLLAEVKPSSPGPGEQVSITLTAYGFDIKTSTISWYQNDKIIVRDVGRKTYNFNLGPVGAQTKVTVFVTSPGGQKATKTFIFDPAEIELFWNTQTSHPAFYQGKARPSAGATIHLVAWPYLVNHAGQKLDPAKLTYHWQKNSSNLDNLSGLGKNSISIKTSATDSQLKISVTALSLTDKISATKDLIINLVQPEILFYEKKPLTGINYGQILPGEYSLFDREVTVRAEPYFLPSDNNLFFKYLWTLDQSSAESRPDDPLAITLRPSQNVSGSNRIGFSAQNANSTFNNSFIIKYGSGLLKPQI